MLTKVSAAFAGDEIFRLPIIPKVRERRREAEEYARARRRTHAERAAEEQQVSMCCKGGKSEPMYGSRERMGKRRQAYRTYRGQMMTRTRVGGKRFELARPSDTCTKAKTRWRNSLSSFMRFRK